MRSQQKDREADRHKLINNWFIHSLAQSKSNAAAKCCERIGCRIDSHLLTKSLITNNDNKETLFTIDSNTNPIFIDLCSYRAMIDERTVRKY